MEGKTLKHEFFKYFGYHVDTPTTSSFNQRRAQILPFAFEFLFHHFSELGSDDNHTHKGYTSVMTIVHNVESSAISATASCAEINFGFLISCSILCCYDRHMPIQLSNLSYN